jgi:hypothetical protein
VFLHRRRRAETSAQLALSGDNSRHRKCLQEANEELRDRLQEATTATEPIHRAIKEQRGVINDIHSRLLAVSKTLEKHLG